MKIKFIDLTGTIVGGDLSNKVQEIVNTATADTSLSGQQLWQSLVYSGASLGADETQRYFLGQANAMVHLLRELSSRLEVAQAMIDDETALRSLQGISDYVHSTLKERATALTSMHAQQASDLYGIDPELITGDLDPGQHPVHMMISVGYTAYRKMPDYFVAWSVGMRSGAFGKLKCKCSQCVQSCLTKNTYEADELNMALVHFGGLDKTFATFGVYLLTECREALYREMSGLESTHDTLGNDHDRSRSTDSAETLAKGLITKHLMGSLQPNRGSNPTPPNENG